MEDNRNNNTILSPQDALISIMVAEGASDQGVTNVEFASIVKIVEHLPIFTEYLNETAYALACDVAASDGRLKEIELQLLAEIRYELDIDRLHGAAIERGARARHLKIVPD